MIKGRPVDTKLLRQEYCAKDDYVIRAYVAGFELEEMIDSGACVNTVSEDQFIKMCSSEATREHVQCA
jgi:hypothetical protein